MFRLRLDSYDPPMLVNEIDDDVNHDQQLYSCTTDTGSQTSCRYALPIGRKQDFFQVRRDP
jgi:hypothetical protein